MIIRTRTATLGVIATLALVVGCSGGVEDDPTPTGESTTEESTQEPTDEPTDETEEPSGDVTEPVTDGAWTYDEVDGVATAITTTAGATLTFANDEAWGTSASLRAEELTWDYLSDGLCDALSGCADATIEVGGSTITTTISRPDTEDDPQLRLADERDLWDAIVAEGGTLRLTLVEADSDAEIVYEFAVDGADPDFF